MEIKFNPWAVPNFAVQAMPPLPRQEGFQVLSWPLSALDAATLSAMCDDFRAGIFYKAGKPDPALTKEG